MRKYPIGIGGVGGSGTRIVAEIIMRHNIDLGATLNESNDNLIFTRNFKKPEWFETFPDEEALIMAWSSFLSERDTAPIDSKSGDADDELFPWGWKEPNTHIFLPFLNNHVPEFRYIHVIRNGLDMAFSQNQQQVKNWGKHILGGSYDGTTKPATSLEYWIAANTRAIEVGKSMGDRFLLLKYEELCINPTEEIKRLSSFLGRDGNLNELRALIAPTSIARHLNEDLSVFSDTQIKSVDRLMQFQF